MRILFLSQYFPPEVNAPASRVSELSKCWAEAGEGVTIITTFPNHPTGVVPEEYRGKGFQKEEVDGCTVLRTWIYVTPNSGFFKRVLSFLSFMISSIFAGVFRSGPCDVVIATSPQIFAGFAGWVVSVFKRKPFVLEIRDLWPDSAIQLGILRNSILIRLSRWLERFLYRKATILVTVSKSIQEVLVHHKGDKENVLYLPNGIHPHFFAPGDRLNEKRNLIGVGDEFVVSYIGTHGLSHGLDRLVEAAHLLRERSDIHFLFIGDGAKKEDTLRKSRELALEKITFLPSEPKEDMPAWYAASDVSIVSLLDLPIFTTAVPSKMFEVMACERPVLLIAKGEAADLLDGSGGGVVLTDGTPEKIAATLLELAQDPRRCKSYGKAGREYVIAHFDRRKLASEYLARLNERFDKRS